MSEGRPSRASGVATSAPVAWRVRPYRPDDVDAAVVVGHGALLEAGPRYGWTTGPLDEALRSRARLRQAHLQRTDPGGAWVAEADGRLVGVALALRRGPLWFLSLLAVDPSVQGRGVGSALLDGALTTAEDARAALVMSSADPKALRRYARAGFALQPGYDVDGVVDRSLLPVVSGVREGDWAADRERVDALGARQRGAAYGPDLDALAAVGARVLVADRGFAVVRGASLVMLAADDEDTATRLLWAALAEVGEQVAVDAVTARQQWALDVALAARLSVRPGSSLCTRGAVGPMAPYLAGGSYG